MAEYSGFFDAQEVTQPDGSKVWDRAYFAEHWADYFKLFIGNGIFVSPTNQLKVIAGTGMNVKLLPGWAFVNGYWYHNDAEKTITIPSNVSPSDVNYSIHLTLSETADRKITQEQGVATTLSSVQIRLANIKIKPGATAIYDSDITDIRPDENQCGFVKGLVDVIDTNDLFLQFTNMFNTWFDGMKGKLSTDAAGNLQTQINSTNAQVALKVNQVDLDATNAIVALKANKSEVTNVMTPKGTIAYASLPMSGNTVGWYYYCPDGDGTNGKGNYVWNGTAWYFGGTGDQGYSILKSELDKSDDYTSNLIGSVVTENLYKGSAEWLGTWGNQSAWTDSSEKINGFKVKAKTGTWSGLCKLINVVSGKSYTFTALVKASVAQNVSVMLNSTLSGFVSTATVTKHSTQFSLLANTWTKITLTFDCTVSGFIAPRIENTVQADFYVAKYKLVEGSESIEFIDVVNDVKTLKTLDVQGIKTAVSDIAIPNINILETYIKTANKVYGRGTHTAADNINGSIYSLIPITAGKTYYYRMLYAYFCTIKYADGTFVSLSDNTNSDAYGSFTALQDGIIAITVSNARSNYIFTNSQEMYNKSISGSYYTPNKLVVPKVYHVEKDGTGDFTKLTDAITEACKYMDSVVHVGAGTWDLITELGDTYLNSVGDTQRGLVLKNRVHVIFSSLALVTCHYTGSRADTITWLSAFNAGKYGFTLENARIRTSKCRYSIHDELSTDTDHYKNHYINCDVIHDNSAGGFNQCIGGGLGTDGHIVIEGCKFENPNKTNYGVISYHGSWGTGRSLIEVKGNYVKGTNTFRFSWYGPSTELSTILAHGNSLGSNIIFAAETTDGTSPNVNMELMEWNNVIRI